MIFRLHFSESSKPEIQNAYNWYEDQQEGLGDRFLLTLNEKLDLILSHPFSFPQKRDNFRESYLGVFPFLIIYTIKDKTIFIHAVFHTSRNPGNKRK